MQRNVSIATLIDLLKEKKRFFTMGSIFLLVSLFILLPITIFIFFNFKSPFESYDTEAIRSKGTPAKAVVMHIEEVTNVSYNGRHPILIDYAYQLNGKELQDKFQTLDSDAINDLREDSVVNIKTLNGESVLTDFEPFSFPFGMFFVLPVIFLVLGSVFFCIALFPALKKYRLYKNGVITDAHFIGMDLFSVTRFTNERMANVDYYFVKNGHKTFATSTTPDFLSLSIKAKDDIIKVFVDPNSGESCYISEKAAIKNRWNINFS